MDKRLLVVIISITLLTTPTLGVSKNRNDAISAAVTELSKVKNPGSYNVEITYYANNKMLTETITVTIVDDRKQTIVVPRERPRVEVADPPRQIEDRQRTERVKRKKKDIENKEEIEKISTDYEMGKMNLDFYSYEKWFLWLINALFVLLIAVPMVILRMEFVKARRIVNHVVTVFFTK